MAALTKAAMRAIKMYKHVVQSVEKFILKCKPEYKVPGLYVIDSIVRQSRHQFGAEKDVFAPRFARNIQATFANLFRCSPEDKSRIIRVLNLWQKNNVFAPETISPLFDLADPNHPIHQQMQPSVGGVSLDHSTNGHLNTSGGLDSSMNNSGGEDKLTSLPEISGNNLSQLLKDPNVLRQLQTLQNFTKFKPDDKQQNAMRPGDESYEKHIQNVLMAGGENLDASKEVEFVSEEKSIEIINLDGNDSRSPSQDRYKRRRSQSRSRSGSRTRDRRRRRTHSRSRSPRSSRRRSSRDRDRNKEKEREKEREYERERRRKGLPDIKKEHLSVCSTTLWIGHLSKLVQEEELSDTFSKYGEIVSINMIIPRGCAFIVMDRRQDAYKAMSGLKNYKLQGRAITISWAAGKGVKSKEWKDYWDLDLGVTYIPWNKLNTDVKIKDLEEGGMVDEDTMPTWLKDSMNQKEIPPQQPQPAMLPSMFAAPPMVDGMPQIDTSQPPPQPGMAGLLPPPGMVPGQFPLGPRLMGGLAPGMMPMGVPGMPPHMMLPPGNMIPPPGVPPPNAAGGHQFMGLPPQLGMPPQLNMQMNLTGANPANTTQGDDQMDIEMDEENTPDQTPTSVPPPMQFQQPPPIFNAPPSGHNDGDDIFSRERNRNQDGNRWGGGGGGGSDGRRDSGRPSPWAHENPPGANNFNNNFNNNNRRGGGAQNINNIPPLIEMNRPDFMRREENLDFEDRRGGGGGRFGGQNMRGNFNQRGSSGGGNNMFMRGQGPRGQGGQNFNNNNNFNNRPFDREDRGGRMRGNDRRGGDRDRDRNWRDDRNDDRNDFKRRDSNNRFSNNRDGRDSRGSDRKSMERNHPRDRRDSDRRNSRNSNSFSEGEGGGRQNRNEDKNNDGEGGRKSPDQNEEPQPQPNASNTPLWDEPEDQNNSSSSISNNNSQQNVVEQPVAPVEQETPSSSRIVDEPVSSSQPAEVHPTPVEEVECGSGGSDVARSEVKEPELKPAPAPVEPQQEEQQEEQPAE
ncbi:nrd-1 family protein [Megaselia abdita]